MKCKEHEFYHKIRVKYPNQWLLQKWDNGNHCIFSSTIAPDINADIVTLTATATHIWQDGIVIKDTDGLFSGLFFTDSTQHFTVTLPSLGSWPASNVYINGKPILGMDGCTVTISKKPAKCECGSHSVGSNRHSHYCPLYKENQ